MATPNVYVLLYNGRAFPRQMPTPSVKTVDTTRLAQIRVQRASHEFSQSVPCRLPHTLDGSNTMSAKEDSQ